MIYPASHWKGLIITFAIRLNVYLTSLMRRITMSKIYDYTTPFISIPILANNPRPAPPLAIIKALIISLHTKPC